MDKIESARQTGERKIALPRQVSGTPVVLCWHPGQSVFALCTYNDQLTSGAVTFFDENGIYDQKISVKIRASYPECAEWHPLPAKRVLIVGWRDGKIFLYDLDNNVAQEGSFSESPLTRLIWHPEGDFPLAAIDKINQLFLWNTWNIKLTKANTTHQIPQTVLCFAFIQQRSDTTHARISDSSAPSGNPLDYLIGCQEGGIFTQNADGNLLKVCQLHEPIKSIMFSYTPGLSLQTAYVITNSLGVIRFQRTNSTAFEEKFSAVLAGKVPLSSLSWVDTDVLVVASVENTVRLWDLSRMQHVELGVQEFSGTDVSEVVRTVSVNKNTGIALGSTNAGSVLFWRLSTRILAPAEKGKPTVIAFPISSAKLHTEVLLIQPASNNSDFLAATQREIFLFQERPVALSTDHFMTAVQVSTNLVSVTNVNSDISVVQKTKFAVIGLSISDKFLAVWGEEQATVYDISSTGTPNELYNFSRDFVALGIYGPCLVAIKNNGLNVLSQQGTPGKNDLRILPNEGTATLLDIRGRFCVIATSGGHLKVTDLDRSDRRQWTKSKSVKDVTSNFSKFITVRLNVDASYVAFLVEEKTLPRKSAKIFVWDMERDSVITYDYLTEKPAFGFKENADGNLGLLAIGLVWDCLDPRLLCAHFITDDSSRSSTKSFLQSIVTFFPMSGKGLTLNSILPIADSSPAVLIGCVIPTVLLYSNSLEQSGRLVVVKRRLPDFDGFQSDNVDDIRVIADFSYFSALGKIAEAVNAVKTSNATKVWDHLAKLCVRRRNLEVSKMCLGKLGRADILGNLRAFAENHPNVEAQLGQLAALLQLKDVAESYFASVKLPMLTLEVRKAGGDWPDVFSLFSSSTVDRLNRRQALTAMAKDDVASGDVDSAIERLTEANCEKFDVPRLLLRKRPHELQNYIDNASDRKLLSWYGHFLEAQGQTEEAVEYYRKAGDSKSLVRTMAERTDEALDLVRTTKDKAAAFQLAHTLEVDENEDPIVLIELYEMASAFSNAIRICMVIGPAQLLEYLENGLDDKLVQLALKSERPEMIAAAKYLEAKGLADKAITLFHRAGQLTKATDLAFDQGYYGNIETISEDIDENSDPVLLDRCVAYFAEHNQVDRAVNLLIKAKKLFDAVKLCIQQQVTIDPRLVTLVIAENSTGLNHPVDSIGMIQQLADRCSMQGLYHEAARLLIEIKRPEAAMYALVKTGDIDAILRYIRIIRDPDALIVAGNNLQAHPWHQKKEIFDAIVLAYKRAGAQLYLASFYDSWAETACDSNRYDIAIEAFGKSYGILDAVPTTKDNAKDIETAKTDMDTKRKVASYFLEVQREAETAPETAIPAAEELLKHCKWDSGVRAGHVLALLISTAAGIGSLPKAKSYLRQLKAECPSTHAITDFVNETVIKQLQ